MGLGADLIEQGVRIRVRVRVRGKGWPTFACICLASKSDGPESQEASAFSCESKG